MACGIAIAGCGASSNPTVGSADFVPYCQKQAQSTPAGLSTATVCRCVQQKLEAAGYSDKRVNDPSIKAAPSTLIESCFSGGSSSTPSPGTPATPSTTTT